MPSSSLRVHLCKLKPFQTLDPCRVLAAPQAHMLSVLPLRPPLLACTPDCCAACLHTTPQGPAVELYIKELLESFLQGDEKFIVFAYHKWAPGAVRPMPPLLSPAALPLSCLGGADLRVPYGSLERAPQWAATAIALTAVQS